MNTLPEPLLRFDASAFVPRLGEADTLRTRYQDALRANLILPNTLEALRVELTYHSNAIGGSTLSLRDTQLVVEGREPNSGKYHCPGRSQCRTISTILGVHHSVCTGFN